MHTAVYMSQVKRRKKQGKIHIEAMNHMSPKVWMELHSVDYAATHVGKKYPSP
jgi:hypothetical protein